MGWNFGVRFEADFWQFLLILVKISGGNHTFGSSCYMTFSTFSASCYITFLNISTFEHILLYHFYRYHSIFGHPYTALLVQNHIFHIFGGQIRGRFLVIIYDCSEDTTRDNHTFRSSCYMTFWRSLASCYIIFSNIPSFGLVLLT